MNIENALSLGTQLLKKKNIRNPKLDTEILMSTTIKKDRKFVILNSREKIEKKLFDNFKLLVNQRAKGKPVAYLIKKKAFGRMNLN